MRRFLFLHQTHVKKIHTSVGFPFCTQIVMPEYILNIHNFSLYTPVYMLGRRGLLKGYVLEGGPSIGEGWRAWDRGWGCGQWGLGCSHCCGPVQGQVLLAEPEERRSFIDMRLLLARGDIGEAKSLPSTCATGPSPGWFSGHEPAEHKY